MRRFYVITAAAVLTFGSVMVVHLLANAAVPAQQEQNAKPAQPCAKGAAKLCDNIGGLPE